MEGVGSSGIYVYHRSTGVWGGENLVHLAIDALKKESINKVLLVCFKKNEAAMLSGSRKVLHSVRI